MWKERDNIISRGIRRYNLVEVIPVCKDEPKSHIRQRSVDPSINIITEELSNKITQAIIHFFSEVSKIPEVKKIAYKPKGQIVTVWTYIDEPKKKILFNIYNVEQRMIENFQDITFDFTVIFNSKETSPTGFHEISTI